jgi:hypothetical protein
MVLSEQGPDENWQEVKDIIKDAEHILDILQSETSAAINQLHLPSQRGGSEQARKSILTLMGIIYLSLLTHYNV